MKKTLFFGLMAAVLGFTACSSDDDSIAETTTQKGMILHATVEQPDETRATFTDNEGTWHFDFTVGDEIIVSNMVSNKNYTFTYKGKDFISTDAEPTTNPTRWYAYYPSKEVSLVGQSGKWEDLANVYVMKGYTPDSGGDVTGKDGLSITLSPKVAILKIINHRGKIDINVKTDKDSWVRGFSGSTASFNVMMENTKQTLLSTKENGTYYIAVPAGHQLAIKDGDESLKSTGINGLKAGQYYEIDIVGKGTINYRDYVALAGYKWATVNVSTSNVLAATGPYKKDNDWGVYLYAHSAAKYAAESWGGSWKLPSKAQWKALIDNCDWEWTDNCNEMSGYVVSGRAENYEDGQSIFLPAAGFCFDGGTSVFGQSKYGSYWFSDYEGFLHFEKNVKPFMDEEYPGDHMSVRPVSE